MKLFFIIIPFSFNILFIYKMAYSQSITWERILTHQYYNSFNRIQNTHDSGYIAVGNIRYNSTYKIFVCKFNNYGDTIWTKILFKENQFIYSSIWIEETNDNGFILIANDNEFFNDAIHLIKLDSTGKNVWIKYFIGVIGKCVKITNDDGFVILGKSFIPFNNSDLIVIKTDSFGNLQWNKTLNSGFYDSPGEITESSTGYSISSCYDSLSLNKVRLIFLNKNGDSVRCSNFSKNNVSIIANSLQLISDNSYLIGGYSVEYKDVVSSFILVTDSLGNHLSENFYNQLGYEECHSSREIKNIGYVLCGRADSVFVGGNVKAYLRIVDFSGKIISERYFSPGKNTNRFNSVETTPDNGIVFGGFAGMTEWGPFGYAVKTDSLGSIKVNISNSIYKNNIGFELFQNYPNPFNSFTQIKYKISKKYNLFYKIYDLTGKLIESKNLGEKDNGEHVIIINTENLSLSSSVYLFQMQFIDLKQRVNSITKRFVIIK